MNNTIKFIGVLFNICISFNLICYPLDQLPPVQEQVQGGMPQMDLEANVIEDFEEELILFKDSFYAQLKGFLLEPFELYGFPQEDMRIQEALTKYLQKLAILRTKVKGFNCRNSTKNYILNSIDKEVVQARVVADLLSYQLLDDYLARV